MEPRDLIGKKISYRTLRNAKFGRVISVHKTDPECVIVEVFFSGFPMDVATVNVRDVMSVK